MKTTICITLDVETKAEVSARVGRRDFSPLVERLLTQWLDLDRKKVTELTETQLKTEHIKTVAFAAELKKELDKLEQQKEKERQDQEITFRDGGVI